MIFVEKFDFMNSDVDNYKFAPHAVANYQAIELASIPIEPPAVRSGTKNVQL